MAEKVAVPGFSADLEQLADEKSGTATISATIDSKYRFDKDEMVAVPFFAATLSSGNAVVQRGAIVKE